MSVHCTSVGSFSLLRPFLIVSLVSSTTAAFAAPAKLTGAELKAQFNGALIEMDTPLGTKIPVRFGTDGLVSGEAGDLAPLLGSAKDRGRWWIEGDRICSKWFRWFDAEPQCLSVQQDGSRLFWQEVGGKTGTATLVEAAPAPKEPSPPKTVIAKADVTGPASPVRATATQPKPAAAAASVSADVSSPSAKAAPSEPLPLPVRAPARPVAPSPAAVAEALAGASDEAVAGEAGETASVLPVVTANSDGFADTPMMRFGGAGLLEASTRIAGATSSGEEAERAEREAEQAPAQAHVAREGRLTQDAPARVAVLPKAEPAKAAPVRPASPSAQAPRRPAASAQNVPIAPSASVGREAWSSGESIRSPGMYRVRGVHRRDVLNVRGGPSEQHAAVGHIPPNGRRVQVTGTCVGEWCPVRYRHATGWVHSFYLADEQPRRGSASRVYLARP